MPPFSLVMLQRRLVRAVTVSTMYLNKMKPDGSGFMTQKEKEWVISCSSYSHLTPPMVTTTIR